MIYIIIVGAIFLADFLIKDKIEKKYSDSDSKVILKNRITIHKFHNTGAFLSSFKNYGKAVAMMSGAFCVLLTGLWIRDIAIRKSILHKLGLSFLLGGAYNNTYDRIKRKYVVDYFSFNSKKEKKRTIIYNISDWFIFIGSFLVVIADVLRTFQKK